MAERLEVLGVPGLPEITAGTDLAAAILAGLDGAGLALRDGDVVVVSSKVVSKAEGRSVRAVTREAAIEAETVRVVAERTGPRGLTRIVESRSGPVLAAAGVDASNVPPGTVLLLPADPDASARALRAALGGAGGVGGTDGVRIGVVVSDTAGRAWRDGQTDLAVGAAGVRVTDDLRGAVDSFGSALEVTVRALADELAAAADLVKGKLSGVPVAVVRGLVDVVTADDGPGARALLRTAATDWFALGHVEAVRSALGVPPGTPGVPVTPLISDDITTRLGRAVDVALAGRSPLGALPKLSVTVAGHEAVLAPAGEALAADALLALGALAQRLAAAAWCEGLAITCTESQGTLRVTLSHPLPP